MIQFQWLWIFLVLPLPWLIRNFMAPVSSPQDAALRVPFYEQLESLSSITAKSNFRRWNLCIATAAWCLLVAASARPQWLGEPIPQAISGRDLMLAVDLSGSMKEQDFVVQGQRIDRLSATKLVAKDFIEERAGDRLGLILFADNAYLHAPLTFDRKTIQTLLTEAFIGMAGERTAIGDAIGLAVKRLRDNDTQHKVLILLTDGANTAGEVSPLKAAELAAKDQLKIYTIGIGADEMIVRSFFGTRRVNPSRDLDESTLRAIAEKTGGRYFRARDTDELSQIYELLNEIEPLEKDQQYFRPQTSLFMWPLATAILLTLVLTIFYIRGKLHS